MSAKEAECDHLRYLLSIARGALDQIAVPRRKDGTYNRDRYACQILAEEALEEIKREG